MHYNCSGDGFSKNCLVFKRKFILDTVIFKFHSEETYSKIEKQTLPKNSTKDEYKSEPVTRAPQ